MAVRIAKHKAKKLYYTHRNRVVTRPNWLRAADIYEPQSDPPSHYSSILEPYRFLASGPRN